MRVKIAASFLALVFVSGCAGRSPDPVAIAQVTDQTASCDQITAEVAQNRLKMSQLSEEENLKRGQNVAAGVAGAIFLFPLLVMDFQDAAGQDKKALEYRNQHLASLHATRCVSAGTQAAGAPTMENAPMQSAPTKNPAVKSASLAG